MLPPFQPADALAALVPDMMDEAACQRWILQRIPSLQGRRLKFSQIYLCCCLLAIGLPQTEIADRLGIDRNTVRHWRDRLAAL